MKGVTLWTLFERRSMSKNFLKNFTRLIDGGKAMHSTKIFTVFVLSLAIGFWGCSKQDKVEAPKNERVEKNLLPGKAELKGQKFSVEINNLKVNMLMDKGSKEIMDTPNLTGNIKITNQSKDIQEIQGATLEFLDESGKPIPFQSGEKVAKVTSYWQAIKPGGVYEGSIDTTIPRKAVKEKALGKIEISLVYVTTPLNRETFTLSQKVE
jgi:hypothetical protein